MIEAVVIIISLRTSTILATAHFAPAAKHQFANVKDCMEWIETPDGDREWRELGDGFRKIFPTPIKVVPACFEPYEA